MCGIFEFCRNKFLMGVYEVEQSRGISGNSRNQGYLRGATCPRGATRPAALARGEEVASLSSSSLKVKKVKTKSFFNYAETWYADSLCRVNIFVFPDCRQTNFLWVYEGRLSLAFAREGRHSREGRLTLPR